jgi:hypothetical protein
VGYGSSNQGQSASLAFMPSASREAPRFTELFFGMADARNEANAYPQKFTDSFVDHHGVVAGIRKGDKYLVLGPKGAGKTAVAEYLEMSAEGATDFVSIRDITDLPLAEVSNLKTGESGGPSRVVTAWKLLVLSALLDLVLKDQSNIANRDLDVLRVVEDLRSYGFMDPTPSRAVLTASQQTIKIALPILGPVYERSSTRSAHLFHLVPYLRDWTSQLANKSTHTYRLFLDGLDSIYLNDPQYLPVVTALVQSVYLINQELHASGAQASVLLLVRNDILTRLSLADSGKMRTDFGVDLDWRVLSGDPQNAPLFKMSNRKAGAVAGAEIDVVGRYFPKYAKLGGPSNGMPIHQFLLNLTRHTPRDLLQLLENMRLAAEDLGVGDDGRISQSVLREGALRYSNHYFVDAIRNELVGRGNGPDEASAGLNALRDLGQDTFTLEEFIVERYGKNSSAGDTVAAKEFLRWLFFAGAIGNVRPGGRESYIQFFHRRDDSEIYLKGSFTLHAALIYAWAIPRGRRTRPAKVASAATTKGRTGSTTGSRGVSPGGARRSNKRAQPPVVEASSTSKGALPDTQDSIPPTISSESAQAPVDQAAARSGRSRRRRSKPTES